jgi:hypothetical protein
MPPPDGLVDVDGDIYAVGGQTLARVRLDAQSSGGTVQVAALVLPLEIFRADLSAFTP